MHVRSWEISACQRALLAAQRSVPGTKWFGSSPVPKESRRPLTTIMCESHQNKASLRVKPHCGSVRGGFGALWTERVRFSSKMQVLRWSLSPGRREVTEVGGVHGGFSLSFFCPLWVKQNGNGSAGRNLQGPKPCCLDGDPQRSAFVWLFFFFWGKKKLSKPSQFCTAHTFRSLFSHWRGLCNWVVLMDAEHACCVLESRDPWAGISLEWLQGKLGPVKAAKSTGRENKR